MTEKLLKALDSSTYKDSVQQEKKRLEDEKNRLEGAIDELKEAGKMLAELDEMAKFDQSVGRHFGSSSAFIRSSPTNINEERMKAKEAKARSSKLADFVESVGESAVKESSLNGHIQLFGLQPISTKKDGNCLPHSLAHFLKKQPAGPTLS